MRGLHLPLLVPGVGGAVDEPPAAPLHPVAVPAALPKDALSSEPQGGLRTERGSGRRAERAGRAGGQQREQGAGQRPQEGGHAGQGHLEEGDLAGPALRFALARACAVELGCRRPALPPERKMAARATYRDCHGVGGGKNGKRKRYLERETGCNQTGMFKDLRVQTPE